jgi:hypothetical protein
MGKREDLMEELSQLMRQHGDFEKEFGECKIETDSVKKCKCMFNVLHDITTLQDKIQLSIPVVNESIALSTSLTNHANALLLEASKWKGDIRPQIEHNYTHEKVKGIIKDWNAMVHDYNISHDQKYPVLEIKEKNEFPTETGHVPNKEVIEEQNKYIFKKQEEINK